MELKDAFEVIQENNTEKLPAEIKNNVKKHIHFLETTISLIEFVAVKIPGAVAKYLNEFTGSTQNK